MPIIELEFDLEFCFVCCVMVGKCQSDGTEFEEHEQKLTRNYDISVSK